MEPGDDDQEQVDTLAKVCVAVFRQDPVAGVDMLIAVAEERFRRAKAARARQPLVVLKGGRG
jgi:hypothetical protein